MKIVDILSGSLPIMEGMIKLPPKLLAKVRGEYQSCVLSYLHARCKGACDTFVKTEDLSTAAAKLAMKTFEEWAAKRYPDAKIKPGQKTNAKTITRAIGDFDPDDLDPSYKGVWEKAKLNVDYEWATPNKMKLIMAIMPYPGLKGFAGQYSSRPNTVEINLERLRTFAWDEFTEFAQAVYGDDADESAKSKRGMELMLNALGDRIDRAEGTVEHELTHYMQFKVFGKVDPKQISDKGKSSRDAEGSTKAQQEYLSSQVEFDPQLKGRIKDIEVMVKALRRRKGLETVDWKPFAKIATGSADPKEVHAKYNIPTYVNIGGEMDFFENLKKLDQAKWKKAVKQFMLELEKRLG